MAERAPGLHRTATLLLALAGLAGCAAPPVRPPLARLDAPARAPQPELYAYPARGQSAEQQQRDRYDCHVWAAGQSGYGPGAAVTGVVAPPRVEPYPPIGYDTAALAATGAVIGAVVATPHHSLEGAAVGALVGAVAGSASDASRDARARRIEDAYARREADARTAAGARAYRRALGACLEGRGYSVR